MTPVDRMAERGGEERPLDVEAYSGGLRAKSRWSGCASMAPTH
jgi:hypothetical protein